jgi:hypothetical protein
MVGEAKQKMFLNPGMSKFFFTGDALSGAHH